MFGFLKKHSDENTLMSIGNGEVVELSKVDDPVFNTGIMGAGYGFLPADNNIYSPVSGKVSMIPDTKHGIGITTSNGTEVLVHMGIDTVELKGIPFDIAVNVGDEVNAGQQVATMDLNKIEEAGKDTTTMVVMTNGNDKGLSVNLKPGNKSNEDIAAVIVTA
ncbi:PTS sugar transporter subunit IIA [Companilactobacillus jidongensis]|uniref:PTS sugar transporter subunit IIA n=1 Tax=Companilactobacillus jidongensis TaxID=2486006 RepID=UPI000F7723E5|nr:PTS glucose transporter subunit IIA [Companilactobacillus jidongensis]